METGMDDRTEALKALYASLLATRESCEKVLDRVDDAYLRAVVGAAIAKKEATLEPLSSLLGDAARSLDGERSVMGTVHKRDDASLVSERHVVESLADAEEMVVDQFDEAIAACAGDDPAYAMLIDAYCLQRAHLERLRAWTPRHNM
jgi:hypothetical protein